MAAGQGGDLMPFVALGLVKSKATGSGCQERLATPATAVVAASWRSPPRSPRMLSVSGEIGKARMDGFGRPPGLLFAEGGRSRLGASGRYPQMGPLCGAIGWKIDEAWRLYEAPQVLCRSYAGCGSRLIAA